MARYMQGRFLVGRFAKRPYMSRGTISVTRRSLFPSTRSGRACLLRSVALWEECITIRDVVHGACEILGIDPLYVANEGKLLAVIAPESADAALEALRNVDGGRGVHHRRSTQVAGRMVVMHTLIGGPRMIELLVGDPLPRRC